MLGKTLKELRKQKGKTQNEIAKDLCIHTQTYQNYELEKRQPDYKMLETIADYFHTTVDYLIGHEVPYLINKSQFNTEQLAIIEEIQKLDKENCIKLLAYIDGLKDGKGK